MSRYSGYNREHKQIETRMMAARENHHNQVNDDYNQYKDVSIATKVLFGFLGTVLIGVIFWFIFLS